ncbi:Indoleamine 2,3-dioxygenase [Eremomyces bilateralis CBS 781.70]|uniref:Indoleamine 2,3-dioxygenase n=1 Tax=Eremomyces bilateralis CBS 781.70 TaxID=1392243 RepID=A0A6G1G9S3_9PEZI|nr:Indoleamine 2,3-dioxygenase [Eremomyces bilateralis CBS 781.70]KAF1814828.1 Indoleamine 2,3-dioxygenase [Eremomyces bilateralis CBS 781.70]
MQPSIPRLRNYDVSPINGFLPTEPPLEVLPNAYYAPWENLIRNLQALILTRRLRGMVDKLPVLSTEHLQTEEEWRRAYSVLAILTHAYVWGGDRPLDVVPPGISIPFLATCNHLELPSVATYAAVVLWNWRALFPTEPVDNLENITTLATFTGSIDESWFYLVSVAIEARGAPIIPMMLQAITAARQNDAFTVTECLRGFAERLDELATLLVRMYENCDPHVFYHRIRPYLAGGKNMAEAGLPNGVMFDDGTGHSEYVQFSGGSNAQSSIIQFFDIVLGVEHRPTGDSKQPSDPALTGPSNNFIQDMRTYMPGPHRRFLEHVEKVANIRPFVTARRNNRALVVAYDACLAMLRAFRDKHIQMVSRYIIVKSRESRSHSRSIAVLTTGTPTSIPASESTRPGRRKLRGTGGTALIPFLKQARDETGEPAIDAWANRLLNNGPGQEGTRLRKVEEDSSGEMEVVGLAGTWSVDDSEGGICHW